MSKFSNNVRIRPSDLDKHFNLRPSTFLSLAEEIALDASESLGYGMTDLEEYDCAWVLSRTHINFHKCLASPTGAEIATWSKGFDGLFYSRDCTLISDNGDVIAESASLWLVMNLGTRGMVRGTEQLMFMPTIPEDSDSATCTSAGRIIIPSNLEREFVEEIFATYSDIDSLGHVNNAVYADWAVKAVPDNLLEHTSIQEMDINYIREIRLGEMVRVFRCTKEMTSGFEVFIEFEKDGKPAFRGKIKLG